MKGHPHGGQPGLSFLHFAAVLICLCLPTEGLEIIPNGVRVREGDNLVLICRNDDGSYPTGGITWSGPSGTTYGPNPGALGDHVRASYHLLYINNVVPSDRGNYQCRDVATGSQSPAIVVVVTRRPTILNRMPVQAIHLHETMVIRCEVDLGFPTSVVSWYKDSVIININSSARHTRLSNGLQIQNVQQSDEGVYECYPRNEVGFDSLFITVAFRAPPQFVHNTTNTTVIIRKGGMVHLDCTAAGAPQPNYTWTVPPGSSGSQGSVSIGPILRIPFSDTRDMGTYRCNASNEFGAVQRTFNVTVFVPPTPILATLNRTVSLGHPVTLHCSVQAQPPPTYTWFHYNRQAISPITDRRYTQLQNGSLHISRLQLSDFDHANCIMVLLCSAENAFGQSQQYYTINLGSNVCTLRNPPTATTDSPSTLPTSTSASTAPHGFTTVTSHSVNEEQVPFEVPLIAAFAVVMFILGLVILAVVVYLVVICRHKKRPPKPSVEAGTMHHTTAVRLHNAQPDSFTALSNRGTMQPPSPAIPLPAIHTTIQTQTHSQGNSDSNNSGIYSKLDHNIPKKRTPDGHRLPSTSSTNSNQPLLSSSSVEEDNAFYDDIVLPEGCEATIAQVCRCENCNCPIHVNQPALSQHQPALSQHQPALNRHQPALNQPTYLQLREDTRNPSAVYETVS